MTGTSQSKRMRRGACSCRKPQLLFGPSTAFASLVGALHTLTAVGCGCIVNDEHLYEAREIDGAEFCELREEGHAASNNAMQSDGQQAGRR